MSRDRHLSLETRERGVATSAKTERLIRADSAALVLEFENGKRWVLGDEPLSIGRSSLCELCLFDPSVSQLHAKIVRADDGWDLLDQHSTNGTLVNGVRTERARLQAGSEIGIGRTLIRCVAMAGASSPLLSNDHEALWGNSKVMQQLRRQLAQAASTPYPVLIRGESGTGKELVAQAVHRLSRRKGPWITMNAAAIPDALFESELFGHERGSFTGANARRKGAFEQADKGTLFLDEVGELPLTQQAKLLRVLELGEYRRVGGEVVLRTDCKFVCATHRELEKMVRDERFRGDLLFRMRGHEIVVPSLRDRLDDLPALAKKLCERVARELERPLVLEDKAVAVLVSYQWPGNVRELLAVLRRAASQAPEGRIGVEHIGRLEHHEMDVVIETRVATIPPPATAATAIATDHIAEKLSFTSQPESEPSASEESVESPAPVHNVNITETGSVSALSGPVDVARLVADAVQYERVRKAKKRFVPSGKALLVMYDSLGSSLSALSRVTSLSRSALRERLKRAQEEQ